MNARAAELREKEHEALYLRYNVRWNKMAVCPDKRFAIPLAVDKQTLMVPAIDALLKYDRFENKWSEHYKYPLNITHRSYDCRNQHARFVHFDVKRKLVYAVVGGFGAVPDFVEVDMTRNSSRVLQPFYDSDKTPVPRCSQAVQIEDNLHWLIRHPSRGRWQHMQWNHKTNSLTVIKEMERSVSSYVGFVHLRTQKSLLLIDLNAGLSMYSLTQQQWSKLENGCEFVHRLHLREIEEFGYVVTKDERFLVVFTGFIWIVDLWQMTMRKSNIVCPLLKGCFHAVLVNEEAADQYVCDGFIQECWNEPEMEQLMCLPVYLIRLIQTFYSEPVVHLFETYHQIGHWKIKLNDILSL